MSPGLTVVLVMIATNAVDDGLPDGDSFAPGIARATREALGPEARVVSKLLASAPSDAEVVALGRAAHADAVVEVTWSLPDHLRTIIRMQRSGSTRWTDREIGFRAIDEAGERSRTVGFAIASMLPERVVSAASLPPERSEPGGARESEEPRRAAPTTEARTHPASSLSAMALAALDVGGQGSGVGGALDFRRNLDSRLAFRTGAGARFGWERPTEVVTRFYYGAAGLAWTAWTSRGRGAALGLRLDALMALTQFVHASPDGTTANKYKLMPGGDLLVEACYFFTGQTAAVVAVGAEAVFGRTSVFVDGRQETTVDPLRPVLELGLRVGF